MSKQRHIIVAGLNGDSCAIVTEPVNGAVKKLKNDNVFNVKNKGDFPLEHIGEVKDPEKAGGVIKIHRIKCGINFLLASDDHRKPDDKVHARIKTFVTS